MTTVPEYIQRVLNDPSVSFWLKAALQESLQRDPVDALNDAQVLADILELHCDTVLGLVSP